MKKHVLKTLKLLAITNLILFVGCQGNEVEHSENQNEKKVIIDGSNQTNRIKANNKGVLSIKEAPDEDPQLSSKLSDAKNALVDASDIASNIPLVLIAEVEAPTYKGTTLKATHVAINGQYAYVSYNVEGNIYLGALDVIDISDPENPSVIVNAIFPDTDLSSVNYYNNNLYLAGASASLNNDGSNPAVLIKMPLENGLPSDDLTLLDMTGYVATDVIANANGLYGVSGSNGVLAKYNNTTQVLEQSVVINDLRAIGHYQNSIVTLSGTEGISVYNETTLAQTRQFATSQDIVESKRTIDFYTNHVLVAEGKKGLGVYNITNGTKLTNIDLPTITDEEINTNEIVTNAVSVENNHIFMANGAAGIAIYDFTKGISLENLTGTLEIDGSTNYVKSDNGYVFVAGGDGGLKIIKTVSSSTPGNSIECTGLPTYRGSNWLNVNSNDPQAYSGSASLKGVNINDDLTFCGSLAISEGLNINNGGNFYMSGSLAQGSNNKKWSSFNINGGATLYLEGSLVIYGNMILNNGAKIVFLGNNSSITVYGDVIKNGSVTIEGNYTDTYNSL